jgi:transposase-like protein
MRGPQVRFCERRGGATCRAYSTRSAAAVKNVCPPPAAVPPNPEVVPDAKRRRFPLDYKLRVLAEADAAKNNPGAIGALLRRDGLYSSHLVSWRRERDAGVRQALTPKTRGRKPKHDPHQEELERLCPENARLTDALSKAELIIDVQKKWVHCWVGICRRPIRRTKADGRRTLPRFPCWHSGCL